MDSREIPDLLHLFGKLIIFSLIFVYLVNPIAHRMQFQCKADRENVSPETNRRLITLNAFHLFLGLSFEEGIGLRIPSGRCLRISD